MKNLTCPQCGAVITDETCPYCGAVFYDFSAITLNAPCYIKIKAQDHDKEFLLRAKVIPREMNVSVFPDDCEIEMRFHIVKDINDVLYTIEDLSF